MRKARATILHDEQQVAKSRQGQFIGTETMSLLLNVDEGVSIAFVHADSIVDSAPVSYLQESRQLLFLLHSVGIAETDKFLTIGLFKQQIANQAGVTAFFHRTNTA